jgi:murein DD-endopeptidase MepM/ murein hydrolase activator NlpD
MDAPRTRRRRTRRLVVGAFACAAVVLLQLVGVAAANATPARTAVDSATASPRSFVPDWDGHTDVTVLSYRLLQRSHVTLRVLDGRGGVVLRQDVGIRDAGVHHATWYGRRSGGALVGPGNYRLRIDARPMRPAPGEPVSADLGGAPIVAGARAATVTIQRPAVALTSVQMTRTSIGRARSGLLAGARYRLSSPAVVSAAIVDEGGRVVRTLASGRASAGDNRVSWDGRTGSGSWAADGEYSLVIAATGGTRPTTTHRLSITVDRVVPELRTPSTTRAGIVAGASVRIPLTVHASEPGTVLVRFGQHLHRAGVRAGTSRIHVDGSALGLVAGASERTVRLLVQLQDRAGNVRGQQVEVTIPRRATVTTPSPAPPATTTDPRTPPAAGTWPWPIAGIVTSEFGLRDGRPHEGIDIAAPTGTPIHPVAPGTVSFVGAWGGYGNLVIVDHGDGITTRYAHLSRFGGFAVGAAVVHTDVIGLVGCTGTCTGPHVHFETRVADTARNPRSFLVAR